MADPAPAPAAPTAPVADPAAAPAADPSKIADPAADLGKGSLVGDAKADAVDPAADPAKPAEGDKKPDDATTKAEPTDYDKLTLPEGVKADDPTLVDFKTKAKAAGLTVEQAQALVTEYGGKLIPAAAAKEAADAPYQLWADTQKKWTDEVKADPEIGGKNFDTMKVTIAKALDLIGGKEVGKLRDAFNFTGAGNNPEIIRFLYRAGKLLTEGTSHIAGNPAGGQKTTAEKMYPNTGNTPLGNSAASGP